MKKRIIVSVVAVVAVIALLLAGWQAYQLYGESNSSQKPVNPQALLKQIKTTAAAGKTITSENFHIGSSSQEIINAWDEPSVKGWHKGKLTVLSYNRLDYDKTPLFQIQSNKVLMIDCYNRDYGKITYQDMLDTFGKPVEEHNQMHEGEDFRVSTYKAGNYTLEIYFYHNKVVKPTDMIQFVRVK